VIPASPVSDTEVAALTSQGTWSQVGDHLEASFAFTSYPAALGFVTSVGALAEAQCHHPEMTLSFDRVHLRVSTHETNSITTRDLFFAESVSRLR